ncbi:MAG: hypothetical protein ACI8Y3_001778, partial [Paraglaciecola sp.]
TCSAGQSTLQNIKQTAPLSTRLRTKIFFTK